LISEVLFNVLEDCNFIEGKKVTLSFHKKIHGAVDLSESRSISKINLAKEEISELIY
jgi:hypothetical protein